jgi:lysophospholipase L1-like esterase
MLFEKSQTVLFQGDSVTDCGRSREDPADLGRGYAMLIAAQLAERQPALDLKFINRGIGGNCADDLAARWQEDCLDLKPDWVSILIGVNDGWRRFQGPEPASAKNYGKYIRQICQKTVAAGAGLIIMEPFFMLDPARRQSWHEDLGPEVARLREVAYEYASVYIPLGGIFHAAALKQPFSFWAADGVHPTMAGHALIARAFLEATS